MRFKIIPFQSRILDYAFWQSLKTKTNTIILNWNSILKLKKNKIATTVPQGLNCFLWLIYLYNKLPAFFLVAYM